MSTTFKLNNLVTHPSRPGEVGIVTGVNHGSYFPHTIHLDVDFASRSLFHTEASEFTLAAAVTAFKVGDRVVLTYNTKNMGTVTQMFDSGAEFGVMWDDAAGYSNHSRWELDHAPASKACQCGGTKLRTSHSTWCHMHESGGTPPFTMTNERLF